MYVKIKNSMTGEEVMISTSKLTTISQVKAEIFKKMKVTTGSQRLLFLGKQLEDVDEDGTEFTLFDYNVKVNDLIQLFVRKPPLSENTSMNIPSQVSVEDQVVAEVCDAVSEHVKLGQEVDSREENTGAWFEAKVERITRNDDNPGFDKLTYHVRYAGYEDFGLVKVKLEQLRPRAKRNIPFLDLDLKQEVMVNYNIEQPEERGFWYDAEVTAWRSTSTRKVLEVTIQGPGGRKTEKCAIIFRDEVFAVEKVSYPTAPASGRATASAPAGGEVKCVCKGKKTVNCRKCGCGVCGGRDDEQNHILCDECDQGYHLRCVGLFSLPPESEEWFCPLCLNKDDIVGGSVKMTKKKTGEGRDWGKGFACQGRTKECTKVPKNHFGPIPGIEVGMSWLHRIQVSEEGVHRPPVAGISGRAKEGCQSIVLAGGYEDDEDNGDTFYYTGAGGRDLSGNKRTAEQSFDQVLTLTNAAIAMNCKAPFNNKTGGDAGEQWREGKPIRVVRSHKGKKHSQYAPDEGNRYDGLYKVVKYWPEKGKKGFIVWRYLFRRDDPSPAPWTEEGKQRMEEQGLSLIYPDGYLELKAQQEKEKKRKSGEENDDDEKEEQEEIPRPAKKKAKLTVYTISSEWKELFEKDELNVKIWKEVETKEAANKKELTDYIEELFNCIICQEIVFKPATTPCGHNFCMECLERSFYSGRKDCPSCRAELSEDFKKYLNKDLRCALQVIFPGYETGR